MHLTLFFVCLFGWFTRSITIFTDSKRNNFFSHCSVNILKLTTLQGNKISNFLQVFSMSRLTSLRAKISQLSVFENYFSK